MLVHRGQQLRRVFRFFEVHVEGDPTHAIGICESRDHANLCFGVPGSESKIDDYRERWETSYRSHSSGSVLREEESYVQP